jgi:AAA ATPase domain
MKSKTGSRGSARQPKARTKVEPAAADTAVSSLNRVLLIGREQEIETIRDCIRHRTSLHLHGPEGVGKSALIDHLYRTWNEIGASPIPIYCGNSGTLREILVAIAEFLLGHCKMLVSVDKYKREKQIASSADIRTISIRYLRNLVFPRIKKGDFCVVLDHLEHITPQINACLGALHERACVITASRQSWDLMDYGFTGRLSYDLWLVPKLRIDKLQRKDAFSLMEHLQKHLNLKLPNKESLFNEIFHITQGNPMMMKTILEKARKPDYLVDGKLNLNLIVIDCRIDAVRIS